MKPLLLTLQGVVPSLVLVIHGNTVITSKIRCYDFLTQCNLSLILGGPQCVENHCTYFRFIKPLVTPNAKTWQKPSSFRQTIVKRKKKIRSGTLTRARLLKLYQISHILGTAFFSWQPLFSPHCRAGETPRRRHYAGGLYSQQQT